MCLVLRHENSFNDLNWQYRKSTYFNEHVTENKNNFIDFYSVFILQKIRRIKWMLLEEQFIFFHRLISLYRFQPQWNNNSQQCRDHKGSHFLCGGNWRKCCSWMYCNYKNADKTGEKFLISFQCLIKLLKYSLVASSLFIISESFFATRVHDYLAVHLIKNKSHWNFSVDKKILLSKFYWIQNSLGLVI